MSEKTLPKPGNYRAKGTGKLVLQSFESGAVQVLVPYTLTNSDVAFSGIHRANVVQKDGTPQKRTIQDLATVFQLPLTDDFWFKVDESDATGVEFELNSCAHELFTPESGEPYDTFKPGWLNPIGGSVPAPMDDGKKKSVANRINMKALFGAPSAATKPKKADKAAPAPEPQAEFPVATQPAAATLPRKLPDKVAAPARTSSADEVGGRIQAKIRKENPSLPESGGKAGQDIETLTSNAFYGAMTEILGHDDPSKPSPEEWGKVADKLGV